MSYVRMIPIEEVGETPIQWVGVYVLRWNHAWGQPSAAFVQEDNLLFDNASEMEMIIEDVYEMIDGDNLDDEDAVLDLKERIRNLLDQLHPEP